MSHTVTKRSLSMLCVLAALAAGRAGAAEVAPHGKAASHPKPAVAKRATRRTAARAIAKSPPPPPALPVARIVERNVAARGGLSAWRAVKTLELSGELDAGGKQDPRLPFAIAMKRPNRSRLELQFQGQTAIQVWDGTQGWKIRPYLDRNEVEPFTADELRSAAATPELDGPLVDHERKGIRVELAGTELVEGRQTYKLRLTRKDGERRYLWIDAKTFLEAKIEGDPRRLDGRLHRVEVFYRDFRPVKGLQLPHTMETVVENVAGSRQMTIRTVAVNPPLGDDLFAKPALGPGRLAAR